MIILKKPIRPFRSILYKKKIDYTKNITFHKNNYTFISLDNKLISKECYESIRVLIKRLIKQYRLLNLFDSDFKTKGDLKLNIRFNTPITRKGSKSRMGKGKGAIKEYMSYIRCNNILLQIMRIPRILAYRLKKKISFKLGIRIQMIS